MEHKKKLLVFLDLEFTQPRRSIIDFGAVVGDMESGKVLGEFSSLVNPQERLTQDIELLTGINDSMLEKAPLFPEVWFSFLSFLEAHGLKKEIFGKSKKLIITWGSGDAQILRAHTQTHSVSPTLPFTAVCDLKSAYSFIMISRSKNPKAGLTTASRRLRINDSFQAHRALADAHQTFLVGLQFYKALKRADLEDLE